MTKKHADQTVRVFFWVGVQLLSGIRWLRANSARPWYGRRGAKRQARRAARNAASSAAAPAPSDFIHTIDEIEWEKIYPTKSRPFPLPTNKARQIALKVHNHYGDEVLKVLTCKAPNLP